MNSNSAKSVKEYLYTITRYKDTAGINRSEVLIRYMSCEHARMDKLTVITLNRTYEECTVCHDEVDVE